MPDSEIIVTIHHGQEDQRTFTFRNSFRIGRDETCDIRLSDPVVSGFHAEVFKEKNKWLLHDAHSTNGTFVDGELVNKVELKDRSAIQCGQRGPILNIKIYSRADLLSSKLLTRGLMATIFKPIPSSTQAFRNYLTKSLPKNAGQYTMHLHHAVRQALRQRSRRFLWGLLAVGCVAVGATYFAWWQHERYKKLEPYGIEIFYTMKTLELQINGLIETLSKSSDPEMAREIRALRDQHKKLTVEYEKFVQQLGIYDESTDEVDRIILRVARIFGECEINAPPDFIAEVKGYISKWQFNGRFKKAIHRGMENELPQKVSSIFLSQNLPPQFFYLAMQESDFNPNVCGPKTRYGIAKGMWQFMPYTASAYGLKIGPLRRLRRPDPRDERHNIEKSTTAAAKMIRDLYNTRAQGSGMLVLASYNWGIGNIGSVIDRMPANPQQRNFWNLVKNHQIPKETYDFVFYVISAAVIGENPILFGYDFENLLEDIS